MGKGKGSPEHWVAVIKPGRVMFEIKHEDPDLSKKLSSLLCINYLLRQKF